MAILSDNPALPAALADVVNSLGEKLSVALAHTSHAETIASRRQIEHVLGRQLEPQFALELVTLLLVQGSEGRNLRAAFVKLLGMTESAQWTAPLTRGPSVMSGSDDAARFLASEESVCVQDLAKCGECLARIGSDRKGKAVSSEEAARLQWAMCAQCRCGTAAWYRS
jgi:hypothetical protein